MWKGGHTFPRKPDSRLRRSTVPYSRPWALNGMQSDRTGNDSRAPRKSRRRVRRLKVPVFPEEETLIKEQAGLVGMTVAAYLRAVGQGYQPRAIVERDRIHDMLRVNGDLGRLGGLLKLWLSDDSKLRGFDQGQVRQAVLGALRRVDQTQDDLRAVIARALRERGEP